VWVPGVTKTVAETVCVRPACKRCVWIPPQYGTRPKLCICQPARLQEVVKPPVWTTKQRDVMVCPPREGWSRICCPPVTGDECDPQECWQKCCEPAVWGKECCPVCVEPERYCVKYTPAQYAMAEERFLVEPGRCEEICEPAMYETRFREVCVRPGHWEWRRNVACEVPPEPVLPPALQVEMTDMSETGAEEGTFRVGSMVRYDLVVRSDQGGAAVNALRVVFELPPQLEFVSGQGEGGVGVTGAGQTAESTMFGLPADGDQTFTILTKVLSAPPGNFVQFKASVVGADGVELAVETESTTLSGGQ
jgi:hypothetical protein